VVAVGHQRAVERLLPRGHEEENQTMRRSHDESALVSLMRPAHAPGLERLHVDIRVLDPRHERGWQGVPEAFTWFTFIPRLRGDLELVARGLRARCEPGSLRIGEPGEPYALCPRSPVRGELLVVRIDEHLTGAVRGELGVRPRESPFPPLISACDASLVSRFCDLYRSMDHGDPLDTEEKLFRFLRAAIRREEGTAQRNRTGDSKGVARARDLLHARFNASLTLEELASVAGTGKFSLLRSFSRELGLTPHAYQVQVRIARACRLIAQGEALADVALAVGYSEQSALARVFRRIVGVTPGAYARATR
jgi:AraC-like DNA-binding protein